jgi:tRNA modification GTPase
VSTIAAIATGPAAGGVGIIRLSGPVAMEAARVVARFPALVRARFAHRVQVHVDGQVVDDGLALYFPAPRSFTGEDVVELHLHGAPRLLSLVLGALLRHPGVRLADAGEFTRRAFLSGRLDLVRAEAVADLIAAESEAQVRAAAAQVSGALSARLDALGAELLSVRADVEGTLDFPDEAEGVELRLAERLGRALVTVERLVADGARGVLVRRGARVVLFGPTNAGKSTLFNMLLGDGRALVDAEPGTTRDALEARLELQGLAVTLVDTAGLREGAGRLEGLGIERSRAALRGADLAVLVAAPGEHEAFRAEVDDARRLEVVAKADLFSQVDGLAVSGVTGAGVEALRAAIVEHLGGATAGAAAVTSERHLEGLRRVHEAVGRARAAVDLSTLEVVGGELGLAVDALAELTGADASNELLDAIFARFCIGK